MSHIEFYEDHINLWARELRQWVPDEIFDSHVHLGPGDVVGEMAADRLREPLSTFTSFTWEQAASFYEKLYSGKRIVGLIAFPFPLREVDLERANAYIINLMRANPFIKGFVLSDPKDTKKTIRSFDKALKAGVRVSGVKPYFDLLGKSCYDTAMEEYIPRDLLEFMNSEELIMMLHTSGVGMGDGEVRGFVRFIAERFPKIKIILAHMGRYLEIEQFFSFFDSEILDFPSIFLEMSSASRTEVYEKVLSRKDLWDRLLFGSDIPFGLITGVEYWSKETGPVFIARDKYKWSDMEINRRFSSMRERMTYNTYHTIKALKDAMEGLGLGREDKEQLKKKVFQDNAQRGLFGNHGKGLR